MYENIGRSLRPAFLRRRPKRNPLHCALTNSQPVIGNTVRDYCFYPVLSRSFEDFAQFVGFAPADVKPRRRHDMAPAVGVELSTNSGASAVCEPLPVQTADLLVCWLSSR